MVVRNRYANRYTAVIKMLEPHGTGFDSTEALKPLPQRATEGSE